MIERRAARRYGLSLPVTVRPSAELKSPQQKGITRDVSTHGVYLLLDRTISAHAEFDLTMVLPTEMAGGPGVFVRAVGKVVRVEEWSREGSPHTGVAVVIRRYEIVRNEPRDSTFANRTL